MWWNIKLKNTKLCEELDLSEPQLDPSITQKYLVQNYLNKNFKVIIYDNLKREFVDTAKLYVSSEVVELDINIEQKKRSLYEQYN